MFPKKEVNVKNIAGKFIFFIDVVHVIFSDRLIRTGQYRKKAPRRIMRINTGLAAFNTYKRTKYQIQSKKCSVLFRSRIPAFDPINKLFIF